MRFHTVGQPLKSLFTAETLLVSLPASHESPPHCDRRLNSFLRS